MGFLFHRADSRTVKGAEMSKWLTDKEKRILFSALTREKSVCIQVDKQCEPREPYEQSLQSVCESLEHKFYYDRLFKQMEKQIMETAIDDFANVLKENYDYLPQILSQESFGLYIDEYAEQLKAGGENENYNKEES